MSDLVNQLREQPTHVSWIALMREAANTIEVLEAAIRKHRDQKGDDRCWLDDQELYSILGDGDIGDNSVGDKAAMLQNCQRFIECRTSGGTWKTYAELEAENAKLREYVRHHQLCARNMRGSDCSCGLDELLKGGE